MSLFARFSKVSVKISGGLDCEGCGLEHPDTRKVIGDIHKDNLNPEKPFIIFIGEAPGSEENKEGRPFVGRSGKHLRGTIEEVVLKNYSILNIIKCRPPKNRNPKKEEIAKCSKFLIEQIKAFDNIKMIITLGAFATNFFLEKVKMTEVQGKSFEIQWQGRKLLIVPQLHPSYYLRRGKGKEFNNDLKEILLKHY